MSYGTMLTYSYVYGRKEVVPKLEELLQKTSSVLLLEQLCYAMSQLHNRPFNQDVHENLKDELFRNLDQTTRDNLRSKMQALTHDHSQAILFNPHVLMELQNMIISGFNNLSFGVLTAEDDLRVLIILLVANEKYYSTIGVPQDQDDLDVACKLSWPITFPRVEFSIKRTWKAHSYHSARLFEYLWSQEIYRDAMLEWDWLKESGDINKHWLDMQQLYLNADKEKKVPTTKYHMFRADAERLFVHNLTLDLSNGKPADYCEVNFQTLRRKPLLRIKDVIYVSNWEFFLGKLTTGFLMDLYFGTSLNESEAYKDFPTFKSVISAEFSQSYAEHILRNTLTRKHQVFLPGDPAKEANQDFYIRKGKKICLIEFKDSLPKSLNKYEDIKKHIDNRLVKENGVPQLIKLINKLDNNVDTFEPGLSKQFKAEKLIVYPVIMVTDSALSVPGIGDYLNRKMREGLTNTKVTVKELVTIELDLFLDNSESLRVLQPDFINKLDEYYKKKTLERKRAKKLLSKGNPKAELYQMQYPNFSDFKLLETLKDPDRYTNDPDSLVKFVRDKLSPLFAEE